MIRSHRFAWLFVLVCFAALWIQAPLRAADLDHKATDEMVERTLKAFHAPGAVVAVVQNDKVVYLKGFGVRQQESSEPVTPDTLFAIASCSKAFTATAAAMLVSDGKLSWDDPVRKHLDYFRLSDELADRDVTVRDLLCHRTGMPRHDWLWMGLTGDAETLIRRYGKAHHSTSFRSTWEYANVPFTAAAAVVGRVEKSDWAAVTRKRIFEPLEMKTASCTYAEAQATMDRATPHYRTADGRTIPIGWDRIDLILGAGCINASGRDMANWLRFQLAGGQFNGKRLVSEEALKETHKPQMVMRVGEVMQAALPPHVTRFAAYGLGWVVHDHRGHLTVSHGGTLSGFRSQLLMVPAKGVGVFVSVNLRPSVAAETVSKTILDRLLDLPAEDWLAYYQKEVAKQEKAEVADRKDLQAKRKTGTEPSRRLAAYAGTYEEPAYERAEVTAADDKLLLRWGKYTYRLDHYHFDTFTAVPILPVDEVFRFDRSHFEAHFRLGRDGEVEGVQFLDQEFKRVHPAKK